MEREGQLNFLFFKRPLHVSFFSEFPANLVAVQFQVGGKLLGSTFRIKHKRPLSRDRIRRRYCPQAEQDRQTQHHQCNLAHTPLLFRHFAPWFSKREAHAITLCTSTSCGLGPPSPRCE